MTTTAPQTVHPATATESETLEALLAVLATGRPVALLDLSGSSAALALPEPVRTALQQVVTAMTRHQAVTVTGTDAVLTTQQAAELLGVSRPTLVRLLDSGQIAYTTPNRHRRVRLQDVLDYQRGVAAVRKEEIAAMTREAAAVDGFASVNGFPTTR